jgi:hypothetical protein
MMNLFSGRKLTLLLTFFAKRMRCDESLSYLSPASAIPFTSFRVTSFVVVAVNDSLVSVAVPIIDKFRTARIRTWSFWFSRHVLTSFLESKKTRRGLPTGLNGKEPLMKKNTTECLSIYLQLNSISPIT